MSSVKKTKTVLLFKLSIALVLLESLALLLACIGNNRAGLFVVVGSLILDSLICILLPLIGLFAVSDYRKTASEQINLSYGQIFFWSILALNVVYVLFMIAVPGVFESILNSCSETFGHCIPSEVPLELTPYVLSCILQLVVLLTLLTKTRSIILGYGLATLFILTVYTLGALIFVPSTLLGGI